jgi:uncharacterized membrane protein YccC
MTFDFDLLSFLFGIVIGGLVGAALTYVWGLWRDIRKPPVL